MRALPLTLCLALLTAASGPLHAQPQNTSPQSDARVIVFFAWDRPIIDGDAAAALDRVAAAFREAPQGRLEVAGHADRSGPSGANQRSARARAQAVHAYLAARGVPAAAMELVSHGEARPLIQTADGVREPQNRRVEIIRRAPGE